MPRIQDTQTDLSARDTLSTLALIPCTSTAGHHVLPTKNLDKPCNTHKLVQLLWQHLCHYLAVIVKVGVEPHSSMASGHEVHHHGALWVVLGEEHVKFKTPIGIGCL